MDEKIPAWMLPRGISNTAGKLRVSVRGINVYVSRGDLPAAKMVHHELWTVAEHLNGMTVTNLRKFANENWLGTAIPGFYKRSKVDMIHAMMSEMFGKTTKDKYKNKIQEIAAQAVGSGVATM